MALEEIERLKEKTEKDPNSKLFVPLAEEYKKAGMYDEAIDVLISGLERQPGYLSARVSLGKIYIERGMPGEARSEFEKVIEAIPDNLYAHKKLAEIYRDLGEKEKAAKEFKTVLRLNPLDEWASTSLSEIEQAQEIQPQELQPQPRSEPRMEAPVGQDSTESRKEPDILELRTEIAEKIEETPEIPDKEYVEQQEHLAEAVRDIGGENNKKTTAPLSLEDLEDMEIWKAHSEIKPEGGEEKPSEPPISLEDMEIWEAHSETLTPGKAAAAATETVTEDREIPEKEPLSFEGLLKEQDVREQTDAIEKKEIPQRSIITLADADQYILGGKYMEAMNIYRKLLSSEPADAKIIQRIEELKSLLKLLGKDKEELIAKLEGLLKGIKMRRDEFFRNP
jgi:tetratricopeptide (TPR) repeat protein